MQFKSTKVFQKVSEGYIGFFEKLPGANTQGHTLEQARSNLEEAIALIQETNCAFSRKHGLVKDAV